MPFLIVMVGAATGIAMAFPGIAAQLPAPAGWALAACLTAGAGIAAAYWSRSGGRDTPTVQERLAWVSLAVAALVCGYFGARRFFSPEGAPAMFASIALLQMTWVGVSIWLNARDRDGRDERDREVGRRACQYAYHAVLAYIACLIAFSFSAHPGTDAASSFNAVRYALIGALLVGQLADSTGRLCLYRRWAAA